MKSRLYILMIISFAYSCFYLYPKDIKHILKGITGKYDAVVGIAVIINGKDTIAINNTEKYPLMSVFKFHQALAICNHLQRSNISCDSILHIRRDELSENTYSPMVERYATVDFNISIAELLKYTLQMSDNNACDILFDRILSTHETDMYIKSLGIKDFSIKYKEKDMHENIKRCYDNWSTPLDVVRLMEIFVNKKSVTDKYYDLILNIMKSCETGLERLPLPLKRTRSTIIHKTGTSDKNSYGRFIGINDIGYVWLPNGDRYSIAVLIKNSAESYQTTEHIIAEISAAIYRYVSNLK